MTVSLRYDGKEQELKRFGILLVLTICSAVSENVKTLGGVFCGLFVLSLIGYSLGVLWYGDAWKTQEPLGVAGNISGVSFATAIATLTMGKAAMVLYKIPNIFRNKSLEEGRREGRQEERNLALEADRQRRDGETLAQAMERLRKERSS